MKSKFISFILFALISGIFYQCKSKNDVDPGIVKIDFDKAAVQIMDTLSSELIGRWNLEKIEFDLKHINYDGSVKKDTIFTDFAVLEIRSISRDLDPRHPTCAGQLIYQDQYWPVKFRLLSSPGRMVEKTGPHAFTLIEWNFPVGSREWKPDEMFIKNFGLERENYSIELNKDGSMTWKGLNRDIKEMVLKKI